MKIKEHFWFRFSIAPLDFGWSPGIWFKILTVNIGDISRSLLGFDYDGKGVEIYFLFFDFWVGK